MTTELLSEDEIHQLLSQETRIETLRYLESSSERCHSYEDIAGHLADKTELSQQDSEIRLEHTDLPKLEAAGVVLNHREESLVTYVGNSRIEEEYL